MKGNVLRVEQAKELLRQSFQIQIDQHSDNLTDENVSQIKIKYFFESDCASKTATHMHYVSVLGGRYLLDYPI